ncbi:MAG: chemotaxis protein CheW [Desulfuromonadaceae bacterium]|nr:chemotaxis protein CheW [Desulfuromonadaceae bacterium]MDD2856625.1 chemotaxis protein CheW [Desulfuromonadaceae bacterium]
MDLAKIRKKSLQTAATPFASPVQDNSTGSDSTQTPLTPASEISAPSAIKLTENESAAVSILETSNLQAFSSIQEHSTHVLRSPMEAILFGRAAAGCDDDSAVIEDTANEVIVESRLEFLCFRVSDEIYGINIMDIKEIIKPREVTEVPRAPLFVSGVLSLRGTIIPIIDMRIRLGLASEEQTGKERIIVIKNDNSFSGLLVDEVIQVVQIHQDALETAPTVLDGIDRDFVSGIGRSDGRLIIILNLENISDINLY